MGDTHQAFSDVCAQSITRPIDRLLAIQRCGRSTVGKTYKRRLIQLCRRAERAFHTGRIDLGYTRDVKPYIAVSCPWDLAKNEGHKIGRYRLEGAGDIEVRYPPDVVLDRVTRFATSKRRPFWIDKLCIDQRDGSEEKAIAMQSMDIVYEESEFTLGLLFVRLDLASEILTLSKLVSKRITTESFQRGHMMYGLATTLREARAALNISFRLVNDNWWNRAWIFQEEYLSGLRMVLLIRSSSYQESALSDVFGYLPGELQIKATDFRDAATRLCLALVRRRDISTRDRRRCRIVLRKASKYNILWTKGTTGMLRAMSPLIFDEIGRRKITKAWDLLPIVCNACDYAVRLDVRRLQECPDLGSLSLAALTTYILNGEILDHGCLWRTSSRGTVFDFLKRSTLSIDPPLGVEKGHTFVKHCRFPNVDLSALGLHVEGIVWKLGRNICTLDSFDVPDWIHEQWLQTPSVYSSSFTKCLTVEEMKTLWKLVNYLWTGGPRAYTILAQRLTEFLKSLALDGYNDDWSCRHVMSIMAIGLARAIQQRQNVRLACVASSTHSPYSAIFVADESTLADDVFTFTSWVCSRASAERALLKRDCSKYASLEVSLSDHASGEPIIVPRRWINGLCFFSNEDARTYRIPWPRSIVSLT